MSFPVILGLAVAAVVVVLWKMRGQSSAPARDVPDNASSSAPPPERAMVPERKRNWLLGKSGPFKDKPFHLGDNAMTIGRTPNNAIQVLGPKVSRIHCRIAPGPSAVAITDMNSSNGTFVNGRRITNATLRHNDEISVGDHLFEFLEYATFTEDHRLARKNPGLAAMTETRVGSIPDLAQSIRRTLAETNGDIEAAAEKLGCEPEFLRKLIK